MRRGDVTLTIALCGSMALHAALLVGAAERYSRGVRIWLPGFAREEALSNPVYVDAAFDPNLLKMRLGEPDAAGYAIDSSPGERQLLAPHGFQDQPFLSRDPEGPGRVEDPPTESTALPGEGGSNASPSRPTPPVISAVESAPVPPVGLPSEPIAEDGLASAPAARPVVAVAPNMGTSESPATPGPRHAADPAPKAASEIDPVSMLVTMDLRRGSTEARSGRKHRIVRPRLDLAAKADLYALRAGRLVMQIRLDESGDVSHVRIVQTSGSDAVDQVCKVAAYEWWFEPLKDAVGNTIGNEFPFVIVF